MSLLEILKVVGFATGAALHLYIARLILLKRGYSAQRSGPGPAALTSYQSSKIPVEPAGAARSERVFILLGLCLGLWFLGNLLITLQEVVLGPGRATGLLRAWNTVAVIGIALFPSLLLHSHLAFWSWMDGYRVLTPARVRLYSALFYVPMVVLPYTIFRVNTGDYKPYLAKLHVLLIPYSIWFLLATWASGALDWVMKDRLYKWADRERAFLKLLALMLFLNGAFELLVVGIFGPNPGDILWVTYILVSLAPTITIAYHIYRYNFYELTIQRSLVYATFAVLFLTIYTYGIRHLDSFLVRRFEIRAGVVEAILILGMFAIAGPLVRVIDKVASGLFAREIEMYRDVAKMVSAPTPAGRVDSSITRTGGPASSPGLAAASVGQASIVQSATTDENSSIGASGELARLMSYTEEAIRRGLRLAAVKILLIDTLPAGSPERRLAEQIESDHLDVHDAGGDIAGMNCPTVYGLRHDGKLIAMMLVASAATLPPEKRSVLEVLSSQVALHIESCLLLEDKIRLERKLAARDRLASLGQMAATVAHEVKNPLSSIKSIAQVMREDDNLEEYRIDLDLIVGEMDRLSATVSQLLTFSRPNCIPDGAGQLFSLASVLTETVSLFGRDAHEKRQRFEVNTGEEILLPGWMDAPLREVLGNLVLNAMQAAPQDGKIEIKATVEGAGDRLDQPGHSDSPSDIVAPDARLLRLSITDDGPGVSADTQRVMFDPFFTTKPRGAGLGLAIVQRRLSELGGSIEIVSPVTDGRGSAFIMVLPISRADAIIS